MNKKTRDELGRKLAINITVTTNHRYLSEETAYLNIRVIWVKLTTTHYFVWVCVFLFLTILNKIYQTNFQCLTCSFVSLAAYYLLYETEYILDFVCGDTFNKTFVLHTILMSQQVWISANI